MIINLVGCIAVGKSTFAKQWVAKHKSWVHLAIDEIREEVVTEALQCHASVEDTVGYLLLSRAIASKDCIIETIGDWWRLRDLYTPELVHRGIYTIRFEASEEECAERAKKRNRVLPAPYDADEQQAISEYYPVPANLVVDLTGLENPDKVYQEIEWYIWKAYAFHNAEEVKSSETP